MVRQLQHSEICEIDITDVLDDRAAGKRIFIEAVQVEIHEHVEIAARRRASSKEDKTLVLDSAKAFRPTSPPSFKRWALATGCGSVWKAKR